MVGWLLVLWGCRASSPVAPEPESWFAVRVGERTVGAVWTTDLPGAAWRGSRYRWMLDGSEVAVDTVARGELDPAGQLVAYSRTRDGELERTWSGRAWWLEPAATAGVLPVGDVQAYDPMGDRVVVVEVSRDGERYTWTQGGIATTLSRTPEGPVQEWGVFQQVPVEGEPALEPVDPVALFRRPVEPIPDARASRRSVWRVQGRELRVEVPLRLEVPAATYERLEELVRDVHAKLDYAPAPGTPDAVEALRRGTGDCNEFAAVFVALAEERGLKARPVSGLVYTEGPLGPGLDVHAWAEVELGEPLGWVAVDPALRQPLADATHLPLGRGTDLGAVLTIAGARDAIEVVEVR